MLQKMRDQTESTTFKVLVGIIVFVLAVFGFGAFNLFVGGVPEVASVNGEAITQDQLAREVERERRQLAARMGEQFDPALVDPVRLQGAVLDRLIARELMRQAADDLGVSVSRAQVDALVVRNPAFERDGRFDQDVYRQAVRSMGYTPQGFLDDTSELMALDQLQSGISSTAFLTRRELGVQASLLGQRRDLAYLPFDVDRFRTQVAVEDDQVQLRYEENLADYQTEESVDVGYVTLGLDDLVHDPSVEVSAADVQAAYEADRKAAPPSEERKSQHILLTTGDQRSDADAIAALEQIKARIEAGESFADVAGEVSEDPGSSSQGGELGFAGRGVFEPAFEHALFALQEPGDLSEPVRTDFGYHLIRLEEIRRHAYPEFDTVKDDIELRLRREQARTLFTDKLRELDSLAFEHPEGLQPIADALGLTLQNAEGITREQGPPPFDAAQARDAVFSDDVLDKGYNSAAVEFADDRAMVTRVAERHEPQPIPFEDVADDIRYAMETDQAQALADEAKAKALERLRAGDSAAEVADAFDSNWQTFAAVRRSATEVPRAVVQAAFDLPRPGSSGKSIGEATLPSGGRAVVTITSVQDGAVDTLSDNDLDGMRRFLADRVSREEFTAFYETLRDEATIHRPE